MPGMFVPMLGTAERAIDCHPQPFETRIQIDRQHMGDHPVVGRDKESGLVPIGSSL